MKNLLPFVISSLPLLTIHTTTYAEIIDDIYGNCIAESGTINNTIVNACSSLASSEYKKSMTADYNRIYHALKKTNPKDAKKLEQSQIAWLEYRNKYCELTGKYIGSPMYEYCPMQLNHQRAIELNEMSHDF